MLGQSVFGGASAPMPLPSSLFRTWGHCVPVHNAGFHEEVFTGDVKGLVVRVSEELVLRVAFCQAELQFCANWCFGHFKTRKI